MIDYFGDIPLSWDVSVEQLLEVPGIGKKKAVTMYEALDIGEENE
jgi:DNA polymerase/3'-5' exonuclease PolX